MMKSRITLTLILSLLIGENLEASDTEEKEKLPKKQEKMPDVLKDIKHFAELDQKIISSKGISQLLLNALMSSNGSVSKKNEHGVY